MADDDGTLLIVGAGQAGCELGFAARQNGWSGAIVLVGDESHLPYQRPPLSKAYLSSEVAGDALTLRSIEAYAKASIDLRLRLRVVAIDRARRRVRFDDGAQLDYRKLAICSGGRARTLECAGLLDAPPSNLRYLRHRDDADRLRVLLATGRRLVVIGGGYVGLEVAASARKLGVEVTLIEAQPRVLARVTGEPLSRFYEGVHRDAGVDLRTSTAIASVVCDATGDVATVVCGDGSRIAADVVVAGLGMIPNVEIAEAAGLDVDGGIVVDARSQTSDPDIVAAGDCTVHHSALYRRVVRLESVPNALEQARAAALTVCDKQRQPAAAPWFWSDQYDLKLQMVGLSAGFDTMTMRGDMASRSFIAFYLRDDRLIAADAVNRPLDFMTTRKLVGRSGHGDTTLAGYLGDAERPLKDLLAMGAKATDGASAGAAAPPST